MIDSWVAPSPIIMVQILAPKWLHQHWVAALVSSIFWLHYFTVETFNLSLYWVNDPKLQLNLNLQIICSKHRYYKQEDKLSGYQ